MNRAATNILIVPKRTKPTIDLINSIKRLEKGQALSAQALLKLEKLQKAQITKKAFVSSAVPLTVEEKREIAVELGFLFGKNFEIENRVEKDVLGGLRIKIGSLVIDNTLKKQLSEIEEELLRKVG